MGIASTHNNSPIYRASEVVSRNEPIQKSIKVALDTIDLYSKSFNVECCKKFVSKLKVADHLCNFLAFFSVSKGILYANEKGKYIWTDASNTTAKILEKVSLFALKLFTFVFDDKFGLFDKGFFANKVGNFVLYVATIDILNITYSSLSLYNIHETERPKLEKQIAETGDKLAKWQAKIAMLAAFKTNPANLSVVSTEQIATLKDHYIPAEGQARSAKLHGKIENLERDITTLQTEPQGETPQQAAARQGKIATIGQEVAKLKEKEQKALVIEEALRGGNTQAIARALSNVREGDDLVSNVDTTLLKAKNSNIKNLSKMDQNHFQMNNLWWKEANNIGKIAYAVIVNIFRLVNITAVVPLLCFRLVVDLVALQKETTQIFNKPVARPAAT